jgi:hypothetical protein
MTGTRIGVQLRNALLAFSFHTQTCDKYLLDPETWLERMLIADLTLANCQLNQAPAMIN